MKHACYANEEKGSSVESWSQHPKVWLTIQPKTVTAISNVLVYQIEFWFYLVFYDVIIAFTIIQLRYITACLEYM